MPGLAYHKENLTMDAIIFTIVILAVVICLAFAAPIYYSYVRHRDEQSLNEQISSLPTLYRRCIFNNKTEKYGLLGSHNASVPFSEVHKNQQLAISSVLSMPALTEER